MALDKNDKLFCATEFRDFPESVQRNLALFLACGHFDTGVSFEEMKLLRLAAGRLRYDSLKSACEDLGSDIEVGAEETSTPGLYPNLHLLKVIQSTETHEFDQCAQIYHVTFAKYMSSSAVFAFVYEAVSRHCYIANIKRNSVGHGVSACRCLKDDAPYIFIQRGQKNLIHDIIKNKWKKITNPKKISLQPYVIEIQKSVYVFGGKSLDIRKCVSGKWQPCAALVHPVFNPMYVAVGNKLTIFDGNSVQLFDATTNTVKLFNTLTIPQGVAVNIANHACVVSTSAIVQFDETTEMCSFHSFDSKLLMDSSLIGAICHNRKLHIITKKTLDFHVLRLSLDDFSIVEVCAMDLPPRSGHFSVLSSCIVQSSHDNRLSPFLNYDEACKLIRRLANSCGQKQCRGQYFTDSGVKSC